jgi:membrane-associated phospholipid phosphatase
MTRKKRAWLSTLLFLAIFAGLLITATFTDFQVSQFLTSKALAAHTYLTNASVFGVAFEALGSDPVYLAFAFAFQILFWYCLRKKDLSAAPKTLLSGIMAVCSFVANYVLVNDTMGYIEEHITGEYGAFVEHESLETHGWLLLIVILTALFLSALGILATRNFTDAQIESLCSVAIATLVFLVVSTLVLHVIKKPVGRIRFRAMNVAEADPLLVKDYGFSRFARWYEWHGQWISKDQMMTMFGTTDALKSFPSGHTNAAGAAYFLPMLNDALKIKRKGVRALLWICPVVITGLTAVSRIIVGAHFFSDVLVGGTCAFVCMILSREIFVCKGANVKAMFGKEA